MPTFEKPMNITVIDHPLVKHKLTLMREADCSTYKFRTLTTELARLMAYEASRDFDVEKYHLPFQLRILLEILVLLHYEES